MQTFRFSSSSLSYSIVAHLGHFVQSPSGMSLLRDFPLLNLGFLTNAVSVLAGGGVTAGSAVSSPKVFFVNDVVAMTGSFRRRISPVQRSFESCGPVRPKRRTVDSLWKFRVWSQPAVEFKARMTRSRKRQWGVDASLNLSTDQHSFSFHRLGLSVPAAKPHLPSKSRR